MYIAPWENDLVMKNLPANAGDALQEEIVTGSSILTWEIPWTVEPVGLQSMGSQRVGLDLKTEHECICVYMCIFYIFIIFYI